MERLECVHSPKGIGEPAGHDGDTSVDARARRPGGGGSPSARASGRRSGWTRRLSVRNRWRCLWRRPHQRSRRGLHSFIRNSALPLKPRKAFPWKTSRRLSWVGKQAARRFGSTALPFKTQPLSPAPSPRAGSRRQDHAGRTLAIRRPRGRNGGGAGRPVEFPARRRPAQRQALSADFCGSLSTPGCRRVLPGVGTVFRTDQRPDWRSPRRNRSRSSRREASTCRMRWRSGWRSCLRRSTSFWISMAWSAAFATPGQRYKMVPQ